MQTPKTITVDGVEHDVTSFSAAAQKLIAIHAEWRNDLADERLKAAKTEAAIKSLEAELTAVIGKELAERAPAAPTA